LDSTPHLKKKNKKCYHYEAWQIKPRETNNFTGKKLHKAVSPYAKSSERKGDKNS